MGGKCWACWRTKINARQAWLELVNKGRMATPCFHSEVVWIIRGQSVDWYFPIPLIVEDVEICRVCWRIKSNARQAWFELGNNGCVMMPCFYSQVVWIIEWHFVGCFFPIPLIVEDVEICWSFWTIRSNAWQVWLELINKGCTATPWFYSEVIRMNGRNCRWFPSEAANYRKWGMMLKDKEQCMASVVRAD